MEKININKNQGKKLLPSLQRREPREGTQPRRQL